MAMLETETKTSPRDVPEPCVLHTRSHQMWQVIYCAKGKNKLLSKSKQTLINEGSLGSSSGSRGNSQAKCHLDIWSCYPTQLGQKMCHFRACELAASWSEVQKVKCQMSSSFCPCISKDKWTHLRIEDKVQLQSVKGACQHKNNNKKNKQNKKKLIKTKLVDHLKQILPKSQKFFSVNLNENPDEVAFNSAGHVQLPERIDELSLCNLCGL